MKNKFQIAVYKYWHLIDFEAGVYKMYPKTDWIITQDFKNF